MTSRPPPAWAPRASAVRTGGFGVDELEEAGAVLVRRRPARPADGRLGPRHGPGRAHAAPRPGPVRSDLPDRPVARDVPEDRLPADSQEPEPRCHRDRHRARGPAPRRRGRAQHPRAARDLPALRRLRGATAGDGATALKLAAEHQPDLVVLDVMLPDMDGFTVTRRLRDTRPPAAHRLRHRPRLARRQDQGPDRRRRRLRHQAVQPGGGRGPHPGRPAPHPRRGRRRGPR